MFSHGHGRGDVVNFCMVPIRSRWQLRGFLTVKLFLFAIKKRKSFLEETVVTLWHFLIQEKKRNCDTFFF